jgi:hypothetical protein
VGLVAVVVYVVGDERKEQQGDHDIVCRRAQLTI